MSMLPRVVRPASRATSTPKDLAPVKRAGREEGATAAPLEEEEEEEENVLLRLLLGAVAIKEEEEEEEEVEGGVLRGEEAEGKSWRTLAHLLGVGKGGSNAAVAPGDGAAAGVPPLPAARTPVAAATSSEAKDAGLPAGAGVVGGRPSRGGGRCCCCCCMRGTLKTGCRAVLALAAAPAARASASSACRAAASSLPATSSMCIVKASLSLSCRGRNSTGGRAHVLPLLPLPPFTSPLA
jgi:hypothetical protein